MQRNKVILDDALTIVALFESSVLGLGFAGHHSSLHAGFPDDPDRELERIKPVILQRLGLESL